MKSKVYTLIISAAVFLCIGISAAQTTVCPAPSGLTSANVSTTSTTVSWNPVTTGIIYNVRYKLSLSASAPWLTVTTQTNSANLAGLLCNSAYTWQVQTGCSGGTGSVTLSPFSASANFTTLSCTNACPVPTGLTSSNITSGSATVSWASLSSANVYNVRYRPFPATSNSWLTLTVQTNSANLISLLCSRNYEWQVQRVCGSTATSVGAFSPSSYFTTLPCTNVCPAPTALTAASITTTSAVLTWSSTGAASYHVRYKPSGSLVWTDVFPATNTITLTGLSPSTFYQWQVRSRCVFSSAIVFSAWSALSTFQTLGFNTACVAPTGLTTTVLPTTNGVMLVWNSTGATLYNIRYRPTGSLAWQSTTSTTNSKLLTGLSPSTTYEWQVQGVCATSNGAVFLSAWSASAFFSTLSPVNISPNPAGSRISISYPSATNEKVTVSIRDFLSTLLYSESKIATIGNNELEINVAGLKNGMYYLEVAGSESRQTTKFLIER